MKYPAPLSPGSRIGITAPSSGVTAVNHHRLDLALSYLRHLGYEAVEGQCLRANDKHVSAPKENRAAEFMEFFLDDTIAAIFPPWGGEFLIDIMPLLDFEKLKQSAPKWVVGYSDTSCLLLALTTRLDIATLHGTNLMDSIPEQQDPLSRSIFEVMTAASGDIINQAASTMFQEQWTDFAEAPGRAFNLTAPTAWKPLNFSGDMRFAGRMIGGCIDVISMLTGTLYGDVAGMTGRYRSDGSIIYFENCELNPLNLYRAIHNLKLAGWFQHAKGILIGRSSGPDHSKPEQMTYLEALRQAFADISCPIIYDVDIGHKPPQLSIVNGSMGLVKFEKDKAELIQTLI